MALDKPKLEKLIADVQDEMNILAKALETWANVIKMEDYLVDSPHIDEATRDSILDEVLTESGGDAHTAAGEIRSLITAY